MSEKIKLKPALYWYCKFPRPLRKLIKKYLAVRDYTTKFYSQSNFLAAFTDWQKTEEGPVFWRQLQYLYFQLETTQTEIEKKTTKMVELNKAIENYVE